MFAQMFERFSSFGGGNEGRFGRVVRCSWFSIRNRIPDFVTGIVTVGRYHWLRPKAALWIAVWFLIVTVSPGWSAEVGEPLPGFAIQTFDNNNLSRANLAGKPMMLIFWNTWCTVCMKELPKINRLAERLGQSGAAILAINTGLNDSESKARAYWKKHGYVFPAGFDHSFEIGKTFKVRGVPTVFLVDSKGFVRYKNSLLPDDIEERLKQLSLH